MDKLTYSDIEVVSFGRTMCCMNSGPVVLSSGLNYGTLLLYNGCTLETRTYN